MESFRVRSTQIHFNLFPGRIFETGNAVDRLDYQFDAPAKMAGVVGGCRYGSANLLAAEGREIEGTEKRHVSWKTRAGA